MSIIEELYNEYRQLKDRIVELEQENAQLKLRLGEQESGTRKQRQQGAQERGLAQEVVTLETLNDYSAEDSQRLLEASGLFDSVWYLEKNKDVARAGMNPIEHYVLYGAAELRNPSSSFNTAHYLQRFPELSEKKINPLLHYLIQAREKA